MSVVARDRPDVFLSYAREDAEFAEGRLTKALAERGKDVWIDVEDIRGGAADWHASVLAGIEAATVMVFVLTPDSLASSVCGDELAHATGLNKRIIPVLRRPVEGLTVPPALEQPNWIYSRAEDDFDSSVIALVDALELDEAWLQQHARLTQRTGEWLRNDRDASYLLRGSDMRNAESWLDDAAEHEEKPTADQVTYITASRRAAARRQRALLASVVLALAVTIALAVAALAARSTAIAREKTARAQALAAQSTAALSRDPEESIRDALDAVAIRPDSQEVFALRRAVSLAGWTSILRLPESHGAALLDVEFSEDGHRVATAGSDGRVAVWDTKTDRRVAVVKADDAVNTVQFSPDGRRLLTAAQGGLVQIWDLPSGVLVRELPTKSNDAWLATWGADGRLVLTAGPRGGEVWNAGSGAALRHLSSDPDNDHVGAIKMSLDGRRAITPGTHGTALLWNVAGGRPTRLSVKGNTEQLAFALLSRDGRRFATVYESGDLCMWTDGRRSPRFCVRGEVPQDADLSRDGSRVLRADPTGRIEVWDVASKRRIAVLPNGGPVNSALFDRSGKYVVTAGANGDARVWQVKPTRRLTLLRGHVAAINRARFSRDGLEVATVSDDGSGRLWPARPRSPADPRWQSADSTAFAPNSRDVLVVSERARRQAVWNTDSPRIVPLRGNVAVVGDPASWPCGRAPGCSPWSPDSRRVAGAADPGGATIWNPATGAVEQRFGDPEAAVSGAAFSPDGRLLLAVDGDLLRPRVWTVATGRPGPRVPAARSGLVSAQFVGRPPRVLTVDDLSRVQLSNPETGAAVALRGPAYPPAVAASGNGREVAVGTFGGRLRVYTRAGRVLLDREATNGVVNSAAFDPSGTAIVTGGQKGIATTWDPRRRGSAQLRAPTGDGVAGAAFSPDGSLVLVSSGATARLWDRVLRRVIVELPRTPDARAEFSPDGSRIVIAGKTRLEVLPCYACLPLNALEQRAGSLLPAS